MQWKFELLMKPPAVPLTEGPVWDGRCILKRSPHRANSAITTFSWASSFCTLGRWSMRP